MTTGTTIDEAWDKFTADVFPSSPRDGAFDDARLSFKSGWLAALVEFAIRTGGAVIDDPVFKAMYAEAVHAGRGELDRLAGIEQEARRRIERN